MKLMRIGPVGDERPAVLADDGTLLDLSDLVSDIDPGLLAGGLDGVRAAVAHGTLSELTAATAVGSDHRSRGSARWCAWG